MINLFAGSIDPNEPSADIADCFAEGYLPALVRDVCLAVHYANQVPIELCLACAIAALAMCAQRRYTVCVTPTFHVPLVMHVAGLAPTGERKSVPVPQLLKAIFEVADDPRFSQHFTLFCNTSAAAIIDGLTAGQAAWIAEEAHYVYSDSANDLEALLTQSWDGRKVRYHRKGVSRIADARMSLFYLAQPEVLARYVAARHGQLRSGGVLTRQAIFIATSMVGQRLSWKYAAAQDGGLERFNRFVGRKLRRSIRDAKLPEIELKLTPAAANLWAEYHDWVEVNSAPGYPLAEVADFAVRSADMCARLAGLFHLCNSTDVWVQEASMLQARRLAQRLLMHARRLFGDQGTLSRSSIGAVKLHNWLLRRFGNQGWCPKNQALREGPVRPVSEFEAALSVLISRTQVAVNTTSQGVLVVLMPGR